MYYSYLHNTRRVQGMYSSNKKQTRGKEIITAMILLLVGCGVPPDDWKNVTLEEYPPKWVKASAFLPKDQLQGLQHAGFFEIKDSIYSHHCDGHGNMIRMKYDEENTLWKIVKYETHGCGDPDA